MGAPGAVPAGRGRPTVGEGRARLLTESARLADAYGHPQGVLQPALPVSSPAARPGTLPGPAGRNDSCPCGSGRKYKRCCGAAASRGADRREEAFPAECDEPSAAVLPQLLTFDREPVSFARAHYRVEDHDAVRRALAGCEALEPEEDGSRFTWFREVDEEERRVLGTIELKGGKLVLECMSDQRLERGKRLLEELAGAWLRHRGDTHQDPWQAVAEARARGRRPPRDELPPEVSAELVQRVLQKHYRKWPDEPLPALDGRTPRECAAEPTGRRRLAKLLDSMEALEAQKPPTERYDFGKLRAELGLEHG